MNTITFEGVVKLFPKKLVGYASFETIAKLKGFWNVHKTTIPPTHIVETDGILWSIRRKEEPDATELPLADVMQQVKGHYGFDRFKEVINQ